jgi:hypothetical protein
MVSVIHRIIQSAAHSWLDPYLVACLDNRRLLISSSNLVLNAEG